MTKNRRHRKGSIRQTIAVLREATTPAIVIRSLKTGRQATAGGAAGTGTVTAIQQFLDANATTAQAANTGRIGILTTIAGAIFAYLWSLWENVTTAAEKLVNDAPTNDPKVASPKASVSASPAPITIAAGLSPPRPEVSPSAQTSISGTMTPITPSRGTSRSTPSGPPSP